MRASVLIGLVGAAALTLIAFPGAPELRSPARPCWALLGFAAGRAMLAVLSMKLTSQPQRWAIVPAAVMAVTGLGLIIVAPGNSVLTDAGWTARIAPAVASTTRVCAYHRAGQRWSDDLARLQDGVAIARDLHALRAAAASLAS